MSTAAVELGVTGLTPEREALLARLAAVGHYDPDGIGRAARPDRCRDCPAVVLVGLDADRCAAVAIVDPTEIDHLGEFLALRLNLFTYSLTLGYSAKGKRRWELNWRAASHIRAPRRTAVVAAHRCGIAIPPAADPVLAGRPVTRALPPGSPPPF